MKFACTDCSRALQAVCGATAPRGRIEQQRSLSLRNTLTKDSLIFCSCLAFPVSIGEAFFLLRKQHVSRHKVPQIRMPSFSPFGDLNFPLGQSKQEANLALVHLSFSRFDRLAPSPWDSIDASHLMSGNLNQGRIWGYPCHCSETRRFV